MPGSALRRTPSALDVPGVPGPRALFAQCALRCGRRAIGRHAFGRRGAFAATPHSGLRGARADTGAAQDAVAKEQLRSLRRGAPCCAWAHRAGTARRRRAGRWSARAGHVRRCCA
ncbi:hypothetical protein ERJ75_000513200 [Trypanosoma vivax]|nr:hypothetical protein ERJ75_000513200 [Trypanosoma vivax]